MGLETAPFIDSLDTANPVGGTDPKSQGDDHIRLIKSAIKATFPGLTGAMTLTHTFLNTLFTRQYIAGNGLTGGGDLTADRTLTLGTPLTLTLLTANTVGADDHAHLLAIANAVGGGAPTAGLLSGADKVILDALEAIRVFGGLPVTGDFKTSLVKAAPTGWVIANGLTIGNAASGGTGRANADTVNLFAAIWDNIANTEAILQDSAGAPIARGANAAADYAANRRMPLPDMRGRVSAGWDNLANIARLTAPNDDTFGAVGGAGTHVLTLAELAAHNHGGVSSTDGAHTHSIAISNDAGFDAGGNTAIQQGGTINTASSGSHSHTISSAGGDTAHNNTQPTGIFNVLIKL